jgi:MFS-type transporter involved in bile tolerance (Atg22 family)
MGATFSSGVSYSASYAWKNPNTILYFIALSLLIAGLCTLFIINKNDSQIQKANQRLIGALLIAIAFIFAGIAWGRSNCYMPSFTPYSPRPIPPTSSSLK